MHYWKGWQPMSEMVERVAKALDEHLRDFPEIGAGRFKALARAAIEAMREPTPEMARAGAYCIPDGPDLDAGLHAWKTMIDEALT